MNFGKSSLGYPRESIKVLISFKVLLALQLIDLSFRCSVILNTNDDSNSLTLTPESREELVVKWVQGLNQPSPRTPEAHPAPLSLPRCLMQKTADLMRGSVLDMAVSVLSQQSTYQRSKRRYCTLWGYVRTYILVHTQPHIISVGLAFLAGNWHR